MREKGRQPGPAGRPRHIGRPALLTGLAVGLAAVALFVASTVSVPPPATGVSRRGASRPLPERVPSASDVDPGRTCAPTSYDRAAAPAPRKVRRILGLKEGLAAVLRLEAAGSFEALVDLSEQPVDSRVRIAALRALATNFGARAREHLLGVVRDEEDIAKVRTAAARLLGRTGPGALTPLDLILGSDLPARVRAGAARGLGEVDTGEAAQRLVRLAGVTTTPVRDAALAALSRMSSPTAAVVLSQLVLDPGRPDDLRVVACEGLGRSRLAEAVTPLVMALGSPESAAAVRVRAAAARALGRMGHHAALPAVVAAEADPSSRVSREACTARIALSHLR